MSRLPGIAAAVEVAHRSVIQKDPVYRPNGGVIDGSESRDPTNTLDVRTLQAGLLLGKLTSSGAFAPAIIGVLSDDYNASEDTTTMTVSPATAAEIVRRIGTTGTFKLTGPPTAGGTVQTLTVTFTGVNLTTGAITITALAVDVDEVQTVTFDAAMTGGTLDITVFAPDGTPLPVAVAWDTNWATTMAAWNTAMTAAATRWNGSASVGAVMTGTATVPVLTFSGNGFAAQPSGRLAVADVGSTTGPTNADVEITTAAEQASGAGSNDFVAGSFIGHASDGTYIPRTLIDDGDGLHVVDDRTNESIDVQLPKILAGGFIRTGSIVNYPTDTALQAWLKEKLRAYGMAYAFDDDM